MLSWCWNGDAFTPCETVPVGDRGFRYGMSLFESLRVEAGRVHFLGEHLARLRGACAEREFSYDARALEAAGATLAGAGRAGFARIYVTAGVGSVLAPAEAGEIVLMLEDRERPATGGACALGVPHEAHRPLFGGLKTGNYWGNIDMLRRARRHGRDEALLFNEHAELISACMANVFVVHHGTVRTPALACGARDGVVRAWVLGQRPVKECSLFVEDLQTADEVFLTNSWVGVLPATAVEGRALPARAIGEELRGRFEAAGG